MLKVENGSLKIFGMDFPKVLVIGGLTAITQYLTGDHIGAVNTILITLGIQKGGDSLAPIMDAILSKKK